MNVPKFVTQVKSRLHLGRISASSRPHLGLISQDMPLFNALMSDLFPGVEPPTVDYGLLQQAPFSYGNRPLDAATFSYGKRGDHLPYMAGDRGGDGGE